MRVFISADIEGTAFTTIWPETDHGEEEYPAAARQMFRHNTRLARLQHQQQFNAPRVKRVLQLLELYDVVFYHRLSDKVLSRIFVQIDVLIEIIVLANDKLGR